MEIKKCNKCKKNKPVDDFYWRSNYGIPHPHSPCKDCHNEDSRKRNKKYRYDALMYYSNGKLKCDCCGENIYEFLAIDHIKGGGNKHRKKMTEMIYTFLRRNNYPDGYRVLCHNCNQAIGYYGKCPHKK